MMRLFALVTLGAALQLAGCADTPGSSADMGPACTPSGLYCASGQMCVRGGRCDGPGECVTIPADCDAEPVAEVCGCDGMFYESLCAAHLLSVDTSFGGAACN